MPTENESIALHNQEKRATLYDVAERAGVSKVAVSVVLNGARSNTRVAEATRHRIMQAAKDLRYRPNGVARSLRRRYTNIIGLYTGDWFVETKQRFFSEVVSGLQIGCNIHRKDLLLHGAFRGRSVGDIYDELIDGKIDGLIMFARSDDPLAAHLAASPLPVVAIADKLEGLPSVVVDDWGGSQQLARYLVSKGHRRVLYRKGHPLQASVARRREAFYEIARTEGIAIMEDENYSSEHCHLTDYEQAVLNSPDPSLRPSAVVAWSDRAAYSVLQFCRERGIGIPEQLGVAGFDGLAEEERPSIQLTTVRAAWDQVAATAVDLLVKRMRNEPVPPETVLPVQFVAGETV